MGKPERRSGAKRERGTEKETYERRLKALDVILSSGFVSADELRDRLGPLGEADKKSILFDMEYLTGTFPYLVRYDHEHVCGLSPSEYQEHGYRRTRQHFAEKKAVAAYIARELIYDGDSVFVGPGGTGIFLACEIALRGIANLQVVTSVTYALPILRDRVRSLCLVGGVLKARGRLRVPLSGPWPVWPEASFAKCFLGVDGLSRETGVYCEDLNAETQANAWRYARDLVVFMTDHSEIGVQCGKRFGTFEEVEKKRVDYKIVCGAVRGVPTEARLIAEQEKFGPDRFRIEWVSDTQDNNCAKCVTSSG